MQKIRKILRAVSEKTALPTNQLLPTTLTLKDLADVSPTKIKSSTNKHNWAGMNFPSEKDDWKKFEKNNGTIALNVLYAKKEKYILLIF